ncbi:MAG: sulfite exporter TauE/SafE family protein [Spirochaetia bacterium]|nr:sulfite exporter TauE/SafE family protein [Spirochaetia bacterium]
MENWVLTVAGFFISMFSSMVGIGGGLLWAPFFIFFNHFDFRMAILFSFTVQLIGMGSASFHHIRINSIQWKICLSFLPILVAGVVIGGFLNKLIANQHILEAGLGVISLAESIFFASQIEKYDEELKFDSKLKPPTWLKLEGVLFSSFSGLFSIGISDFLIPLFRGKLKIPMINAIGTGIFLNFASSVIGTVFSFSFQHYKLPPDTLYILGFCWFGVLLGGQTGPRLAKYISDDRMKELFIFAMLLLGIHLIYQSL